MTARHSTPIPPFPATINRQHFGSWISGFVDGEGTFVLALNHSGSRPVPVCRFQIKLRADDTPVLERIRSFLGCGLMVPDLKTSPKHPGDKPQMAFVVVKGEDLFRIVIPHFKDYPLQAKKRFDFPIWERGVNLVHELSKRKTMPIPGPGRRGYHPKWKDSEIAEFVALRDALRAQRLYSAPAFTLPPPNPPRPEPPSLFDALP
jgi:hypothetical protein